VAGPFESILTDITTSHDPESGKPDGWILTVYVESSDAVREIAGLALGRTVGLVLETGQDQAAVVKLVKKKRGQP